MPLKKENMSEENEPDIENRNNEFHCWGKAKRKQCKGAKDEGAYSNCLMVHTRFLSNPQAV